ncbi:MAG TPA: hypothetical protein VLE69_03535 [Candidatus Saccharimonadales bacterium]|nr:hypothetical protein [Candidatus Saccharimonadales bacterium]
MTATNHVLTGAVIGAVITMPIIALPVAFASHFALDALPHYDSPGQEHTSRRFLYTLFTDMAIAASILLAIILLRPDNWPLLVACGIAAASPDLMWLPRWLNEIRHKPNKPMGPFRKFHSRIQRYAKPQNWPVEVVWFVLFSVIFLVKTTP